MEFTSVIVKAFNIEQMDLKYYVGINQIRIELDQFLRAYNVPNEEAALNHLFKLMGELQNKNKELIIQVIKDDYVLNQDHIFIACYYLQKALFHESLISNKKNIELLLYLSTRRQISEGIKSFGVDTTVLKEGRFTICVISPINNLSVINKEILETLKATEIKLSINDLTPKKIKNIIKFYEFSELQIKSVLRSYGINNINLEKPENYLHDISPALFDLICEKMALLNLEKIKLG
jgi:tRNA threonylcarbamoyladenosine modification (KEOPS) complex Cgi121 subunit